MFSWIVGVIGLVLAGAVGLGGIGGLDGFGSVTAWKGVLLSSSFAIAFIALLIAVASRGGDSGRESR